MKTPGLKLVSCKKNKGGLIRSLILLLSFQYKYCRVSGQSMIPLLKEGDIVLYKPLRTINQKRSVFEGSIVIVIDPLNKSDLIIKRVKEKNHKGINIIGENTNISIDSRHFGLISYEYIYGLAQEVIKNPFQ